MKKEGHLERIPVCSAQCPLIKAHPNIYFVAKDAQVMPCETCGKGECLINVATPAYQPDLTSRSGGLVANIKKKLSR